MPAAAAAQSARTARESADLMITPGGRVLATVAPLASVQAHETKGAFTRVTVRGFVDTAFLGGARDSFANSIRGPRGTVRLRATGSRSAQVVADLYAGMGLSRVTRSGAWAQVERGGWIRTASLSPAGTPARTPAAVSVRSQPQPAVPQSVPPPESQPAQDTTVPVAWILTPSRPTEMRVAPGGQVLATARPGAIITPLARERGWVRVKVEGWMQEKDLVAADSAARRMVSAADLRADPDGNRGRTVSWEVQILRLQFADPLRPSMAPDEPYLLARGPGTEAAVLYLAVPPSLLATARSLPPLSKVSITARVRSGRSEPVGVPILDLMRIVRL